MIEANIEDMTVPLLSFSMSEVGHVNARAQRCIWLIRHSNSSYIQPLLRRLQREQVSELILLSHIIVIVKLKPRKQF
jgi:hypothetical protein